MEHYIAMKKLVVFLGDIVIGVGTSVLAVFVLSLALWPFISAYLSIDAGTPAGAWTYFFGDHWWAVLGNVLGIAASLVMFVMAICAILEYFDDIMGYIGDRLEVMMELPGRFIARVKEFRRPKAPSVVTSPENHFDEDEEDM